MRRATVEYVYVGRIDLPAELAEELRLLLLDPMTQRIRYGAMRSLCVQLFSNWVDDQRNAGQPGAPLPHLPHTP